MGLLDSLRSTPPNTLTADERSRLVELEKVLTTTTNINDLAVKALAEIREKRLYREKAPTFAAYVEQFWGITVRRAQQLLAELRDDAKGNFAPPPATSSSPPGPAPDQVAAEPAAAGVLYRRRGTRRHARRERTFRLKGKGWTLVLKHRQDVDPAAVIATAAAGLAQQRAA